MTWLGNLAGIFCQSQNDFAAGLAGSGPAIYMGPFNTWPSGSPPYLPNPGVGVHPMDPFTTSAAIYFADFAAGLTGGGSFRYTNVGVTILSWDAAPYLAYYHLGWKSASWSVTVFVHFVQQQAHLTDSGSSPEPVEDLVCCIPGSVTDVTGFGPWTNEGDDVSTLPTPWGGQVDFTDSRWAFPARPFGSGGWTEKGRVSWGAAFSNVDYAGTATAGVGTWTIPIDLTTDLRDGRLCLAFAVDPWFSGSSGEAPNIWDGLTSDPDHRVAAPPFYTTAQWYMDATAIVEPDPKTGAGPPLRMRQRWLLTSSHAAQARTHPVITRARGDIG